MLFKSLILSLSIFHSSHACFVDVSKETHGWERGSTNVISDKDQIYFINLLEKGVQEVGKSVVLVAKDDTFVFTFGDDDKKTAFVQFINSERAKCK